MYAQLCKRLSEEAPNFEPQESPSTFRILLLNKCQDEFENRSKATEFYENRDGLLTSDEEEQRQLAKRKMLGNVRFIGELGKLELLREKTLHQCCQKLLENKRKRGGIRDMAEDLECLSQIMKTCGRILDTEKGKNLMDQYFDRMRTLVANHELPSRIRFMLQDVTELRENKWVPRKVASSEGPRTIQQIREEAARDVGVYIPPPSSGPNPRMSAGLVNPLVNMPGFFPRMPKSRGGMDDVFGSLPMGAATLGTGPGVIPTQDKISFETNGFQSGYRPRQQYPPQQAMFQSRQNYMPLANNMNNKQQQQQMHQNQMNQQQNMNNSSKDVPPRFKKMMAQQQPQGNVDEVQLRPSANSMMLKPKTPSSLPKSAMGTLGSGNLIEPPLPPPPQPVIPNQKPLPSVVMQKEAVILIKQASLDKTKGMKKDKGPSKQDVLKKVEGLLKEDLNNKNVNETLAHFKELKVPERYVPDALTYIMTKTLDRSDADRELVSMLIAELKKEGCLVTQQFLEAFKDLLNDMSELESDIPRVKSYVAAFASRAVVDELTELADLAEPMENDRYYPLFLLTLQHLHKTKGKPYLTKVFNESKVNLMNMLPEIDRTKERLAEILEDRELSFLFPLLRIQSELSKQLQADPSPAEFRKWIKDNLDSSHYTAPGFINALMTVLVKFINQETVLAESSDAVNKAAQAKEKKLTEKFKSVLQTFLHDHVGLQVVALYALQVYCFSLQFPKGMLLRWFLNLYNMDVIEEEAFLKWKEDINDDYPGKGQALFQVNQWLTWLETAESDDADDVEADDADDEDDGE